MQAAGIGAVQFGMMSVLAGRPGITVTDLAHALDLDRTTLTRNLKPLSKAKLVEVGPGRDHRSRAVSLTGEGRARLAAAHASWRQAQAELEARLGTDDARALNHLLARAIERLGT